MSTSGRDHVSEGGARGVHRGNQVDLDFLAPLVGTGPRMARQPVARTRTEERVLIREVSVHGRAWDAGPLSDRGERGVHAAVAVADV